MLILCLFWRWICLVLLNRRVGKHDINVHMDDCLLWAWNPLIPMIPLHEYIWNHSELRCNLSSFRNIWKFSKFNTIVESNLVHKDHTKIVIYRKKITPVQRKNKKVIIRIQWHIHRYKQRNRQCWLNSLKYTSWLHIFFCEELPKGKYSFKIIQVEKSFSSFQGVKHISSHEYDRRKRRSKSGDLNDRANIVTMSNICKRKRKRKRYVWTSRNYVNSTLCCACCLARVWARSARRLLLLLA